MFRIDDIGASTKKFNQHGKKTFRWKGKRVFYFPLANFWFLKRIKPFKQWAPYNEITKKEWEGFLNIFEEYNVKPVLAVTACWVEKDGKLVLFFEKFKEQALFLRKAFLEDKVTIANHGLTHCVVGKHLPLFFKSNREYHREFWPYLDKSVHTEHIIKSQKILEGFFGKQIEMFVPPGNIWSFKTYEALKRTNVKKVVANRYMADSEEDMIGIEFIDDRENGSFILHDKDLHNGEKWLKNVLRNFTKQNT